MGAFDKKALVCLKSIKKRDEEKVFPLTDNAFRHAWNRLIKHTKIKALTFHDLRHEAISRMFESGYSIPQIMAISGHKTVSQLFRYVQLQEWGGGSLPRHSSFLTYTSPTQPPQSSKNRIE